MAPHALLDAKPSRTKSPELAEVLHQIAAVAKSLFDSCKAAEGRRSRGAESLSFRKQKVRVILGAEPTP